MENLTYGFQDPEIPKHLAVFLHGFPAVRSRQNREIAERAHQVTGDATVVFLYDGLGVAPGIFSFSHSLNEVREKIRWYLNNGVQTIDLVGHSWGGFLSLLIAAENPGRVRRVVLMSPLLFFADENRCIPAFIETARDNPGLTLAPPSELGADFVDVGAKHQTEKVIAKLPADLSILFLQAKEDQVTPTSIADEWQKKFAKAPLYERVETDHSFLINRPILSERIAAFLKEGL